MRFHTSNPPPPIGHEVVEKSPNLIVHTLHFRINLWSPHRLLLSHNAFERLSVVPTMSGLSSRGAHLPFPPIQDFHGRNLSAHRASMSDEGPANVHNSRPLADFDTDMVDTTAGSSVVVNNAVSPDDGSNEDDTHDTKKDTKVKMKMAAIPEYFATKRTKGRCFA